MPSAIGAPQLSMTLITFSKESAPSWEPLVERARLLDRAGVDRLVVSEHVVFGEQLDDYARPELGGTAGGRQPTGPDGAWLDPLTTLTFVAGQTTRIRLGTNILIAALRRPVVLAKTAATLDVLSGGRLDLGVGVGWQRAEYESAGLAFEDRGRLLDDSLAVCQSLWRDTVASHDSPHLQFDGIHMMPKPTQAGGVPLFISGTVNARVIRRLARFGSGWIPWGAAAADLPAAIPEVRKELEAAGRDPSELQIVGTLPVAVDDDKALDIAATMAGVPALVEAGVTDFRAGWRPPPDPAAAEDQLHAVVAAFRTATGRPAPG